MSDTLDIFMAANVNPTLSTPTQNMVEYPPPHPGPVVLYPFGYHICIIYL